MKTISTGLPESKLTTIVHINIAGFLAAVEQASQPDLRGTTFVIGKAGVSRGQCLDVSPAAYAAGIRRGMPLERCTALYPGIAVLPPSYESCRAAEERIAGICRRYTPLVEVQPGGHFFLDVRRTVLINGEPAVCAARLRADILRETGIVAGACVASSKLAAKVGSRVAGPAGFLVVPAGREREFFSVQDSSLLPGVGPKLAAYIESLGMRELAAIGNLNNAEALAIFGSEGARLRDRARGIDTEAVQEDVNKGRHIEGERVLDADSNDPVQLRILLIGLVSELGFTLRSRGLSARRIGLEIDYSDGYCYRDGCVLAVPGFLDTDLTAAASRLLRKASQRRVRLRRLGLSLSGFSRERVQMDLFLPPQDDRQRHLQEAIDASRKRYGANAVVPGVTVTRQRQVTGHV